MSKLAISLISALCYATFLYEFVFITRDYLRYDTITKVEYYSENKSRPPALTLGFQTPIPIADLQKRVLPNESYFFDEIGKFNSWKSSRLGKNCIKAITVTENSLKSNNSQLLEIWNCFVHYFGNIPIKEFLTKLTLLYSKYLKWNTKDSSSFEKCNISLNDLKLAPSIGSRGLIGISLFSDLPSCLEFKPRDACKIWYKYAKIQPFKGFNNYVQLQLSETVPHLYNAHALNIRADHTINYHSTRIRRQGPPYDTACHDYNKAPPGGAVSQSDCIATCVFGRETGRGAQISKYFENAESFFIKPELFPESANVSEIKELRNEIGKELERDMESAELTCKSRCPLACTETTFDWTLSGSQSNRQDQIQITLKHQFDKNQLYFHLPAMDWFTYLANLGGLAGMWTGLSFLSLFSALYKSLKSPASRRLGGSRWVRISRQLKQ